MLDLKNLKTLRLFRTMRLHGCHTQAALSCLGKKYYSILPIMFEAFTTVPFGFKHVPQNPNRTIDCIIDPDEGLNFAASSLGFEVEYLFSRTNDKLPLFLEKLKYFLKTNPVLLGPLDMGKLPFLEDRYHFKGIDHYVVALGIDNSLNTISLLDPERIGVVTIELDRFISSWQADGLIEGRGGYTMRQFQGDVAIKTEQMKKRVRGVVNRAVQNIQLMEEDYIEDLLLFSIKKIDRLKTPSLWSGMMFCLNTQIRRTLCAYFFIMEYLNQAIEETNCINLFQDKLTTIELLINKMASHMDVVPREIELLAELELKIGGVLREL